MVTTTISNREDVLDSRDIIARIEELTSDREDLEGDDLAEWVESDDGEELAALVSLQDDGEQSPDWQYGESLIRGSYFEDYARELADDIGAIDKDAGWPASCIDWSEAADQLKQDYFDVDFDGVEYWIRG